MQMRFAKGRCCSLTLGIAVLICLAGIVSILSHGYSTCNVPLAYVEHLDGGQYALRMRKGGRVRTVARWHSQDSDIYSNIVGYDPRSKTWVLSSEFNRDLGVIRGGGSSIRKLSWKQLRVYDLRLADGKLISAYDEDGTIIVAAFGLDGRLLSKHTLQTPRSWSPEPNMTPEVAVSPTGDAAVSLVPPGSNHSDLYLYDSSGKEVAHHDRGIIWKYDPTGRFLLYDDSQEVLNSRSRNGKEEPDIRGPGTTVVEDLKSGKKRTIPGFDHWAVSGGVPSKLAGPEEIQWAPGSRWLMTDCEPNPLGTGIAVCTRCVFALDLRANRLQWRRMYDLPWVNCMPVDDAAFEAVRRR